jgi:uncharacterized protein YjbI with pentapeptide repeats
VTEQGPQPVFSPCGPPRPIDLDIAPGSFGAVYVDAYGRAEAGRYQLTVTPGRCADRPAACPGLGCPALCPSPFPAAAVPCTWEDIDAGGDCGAHPVPETCQVIRSSLSGSRLVGANLAAVTLDHVEALGADFSTASMDATVFEGVDLRGARFEWTSMRRADINQADLSQLRLTGANLQDASLRRVRIAGSRIHEVSLSRATLDQVVLRTVTGLGLDFDDATLRGVELREAQLADSTFRRTRFRGVTARGLDLRRGDFAGARFEDGTDLRNVVLLAASLVDAFFAQGTRLWGADLRFSNLQGARLEGASLSEIHLDQTDLSGASLRGMRWIHPGGDTCEEGREYRGRFTPSAIELDDFIRACPIFVDSADLSGAELHDLDLPLGFGVRAMRLDDARVSTSDWAQSVFVGGQGRRLQLEAVNLEDSDWGGAALEELEMVGVNATRLALRAADLHGARFEATRLVDAAVTAANLAGSVWVGTTVAGADFSHSTLAGADLRGMCQTDGANFEHTNLTGAVVCPHQVDAFPGQIAPAVVVGDCAQDPCAGWR